MSFSLVGEAGLEAVDKHLECQALASSSTPCEHQKSSIRRPRHPNPYSQRLCKYWAAIASCEQFESIGSITCSFEYASLDAHYVPNYQSQTSKSQDKS